MRKQFLLFVLHFYAAHVVAQLPDSARVLDEVVIKAFEQNSRTRASAAAVEILSRQIDRSTGVSLVNSFNSLPGIRMEERSPASYRINIRGSSLRSPFGVRNVKVYWHGIPVTDAGGNTYFNQFALNNFSLIEIYKGPAGSLYGAGTGGLILLERNEKDQQLSSVHYTAGSYGLHNVMATASFSNTSGHSDLSYAHQQAKGYRTQSASRRDNLSWHMDLLKNGRHQLSASLLFNDLYYETPGALTAAEYKVNARAARPAAGGFPSAVAANASIYQKNMTIGVSNVYRIDSSFANTTTVYASYARIKNAAIRNYERRTEPGFGGRTVFTFDKKASRIPDAAVFKVIAGGEYQKGFFNTQVSNNRNGRPDTLQTNDDIEYTNWSIFLQGNINLPKKWLITAGVSLNKTSVAVTRLSIFPVISQRRNYQNELAPRIVLQKNFRFIQVSGIISRGFSPPTVAEVLPSTGRVSTDLEAEYGWNLETKMMMTFLCNIDFSITGYLFRLNDALVQRRDPSGADYFINAGNTNQRGIEAALRYHDFFSNSPIEEFDIKTSFTYSHYRYGTFKRANEDYSGKTLPGVPAVTVATNADLHLRKGFFADLTYYYSSKIFLNDANTANASHYHLFTIRGGWEMQTVKKIRLRFFAGIDNLFDESYSLGNDINAAGGRYFNAAPGRNYFTGVVVVGLKKFKHPE